MIHDQRLFIEVRRILIWVVKGLVIGTSMIRFQNSKTNKALVESSLLYKSQEPPQ